MTTPSTKVTDAAMGIAFVYRASQPDSSIWNPLAVSFGLPYFSISVSLNILLSLMIIIRLVLHNINIRNIMGAPAKTSGLYQAINAIVIMLVESSALYAVTSLLFIGPWSVRSYVGDIFLPILAEIQVGTIYPSPDAPQSWDWLPDLSDEIGHCSISHHPKGRRPEGVGGELCDCPCEHQSSECHESREVCGRLWGPS